MTSGLAEAGDADAVRVHAVQGAQVGDGLIQVAEGLVVGDLRPVVAAAQDIPVAGEAGEHVGSEPDVAFPGEAVRDVRGVLIDRRTVRGG